ncbi:hypothetical protein OH492_10205 [Vibrio chagasii]|nr:hypothetical protein [Vibrio chagasii]
MRRYLGLPDNFVLFLQGFKDKATFMYDSFDAVQNVTQKAARMAAYRRQRKRCKRRKTRRRLPLPTRPVQNQTFFFEQQR